MIFLAQITGRTNLKFMRHQFVKLIQNRNISKSLVTSSNSVEHSNEEVEDKMEKVRIVFISDTHSDHTKLGKLPHGDILVHAGDFTQTRPSKPCEYKEFVDWFSSQPQRHKLLISGNRDGFMDTKNSLKYEVHSGFWMKQMQNYVKEDKNIKYLEDEKYEFMIENEQESKIIFYGTPWTGIHGKPGKGFQIPKLDLSVKWNKIPRETNILISHMPPYNILDMNRGGVKAGCKDLYETVTDRVKPRIHVFGHIHEGAGHVNKDGILYINAASKNSQIKTTQQTNCCGLLPPFYSS